jgi:maltooligosyltrehalose trehalohydrolase
MHYSWGIHTDEGSTRFRIWAPAQAMMTLRLDSNDLVMTAMSEGWFEAISPDARPGSHYEFVLADGTTVPDPTARAQVGDVHGASLVTDPHAYRWQDAHWRGRPWREAIIYEVHIGTFTPQGTFAAAIEHLSNLAQIGITAIELMPVAQFGGERGWGYDGVLLHAPHRAYGTPDDMKAFIDIAHHYGIMVILDVVYNHFGPEGNYLPLYAPQFFHAEEDSPWGPSLAFEQPAVRQFVIDNVLYWLDEFHLDGLRFDAIHGIRDDTSELHILEEIARASRRNFADRDIHLVTEDSRNITYLHERDSNGGTPLYTAEWNDDYHHVLQVIAVGETQGHYTPFADAPYEKLAKALAFGFVVPADEGRVSSKEKHATSGHLPPIAFVDFIQNHDQVGNRAFGDRLVTMIEPWMARMLTALLLLSPHIPLLFMGDDYGETRPFLFFCDYSGTLAEDVRRGRRQDTGNFGGFSQEEQDSSNIPDPNSPATFERSKLSRARAATAAGLETRDFLHQLLVIRCKHIVPLLGEAAGHSGRVLTSSNEVVAVEWRLGSKRLSITANFSAGPLLIPQDPGQIIFASTARQSAQGATLAGHSLLVSLYEETGGHVS